jgi:di/tricarboxylate transporter
MEEAYRAIEWKAVFLIAGMLPLGIAMEQTGAGNFLAEGMVGLVGGLGPLAVMAGLFLLAALASQVMPNPAVAVLLAPIALNTASDLGISPYTAHRLPRDRRSPRRVVRRSLCLPSFRSSTGPWSPTGLANT